MSTPPVARREVIPSLAVRAVANEDTLARLFLAICDGEADSRMGLVKLTGLARATVADYVGALLTMGYLVDAPRSEATRGRPTPVLKLGPRAPLVAVVNLDMRSMTVARVDLAGSLLATESVPVGISDGVERCVEATERMLSDVDATGPDTRQIIVSVPMPVRDGTGVIPHGTPRGDWSVAEFAEQLEATTGTPVAIENDANLAALGEDAGGASPLIYAHVSAGFGVGILTGSGEVHRGADGLAGEIGHLQWPALEPRPCRCGRLYCVGRAVGLRSIADDLGFDLAPGEYPAANTIKEIRTRYRSGDPTAVSRIHAAASVVGQVMSVFVDFYNPRTVVVGGPVAAMGDGVLSAIRQEIYERALPASSRSLMVRLAGEESLVRGAGRQSRKILLRSGGLFSQ